MIPQDTICAAASSVGGGAVAIVRLSGPDALEIAGTLVRLKRGSVSDSAANTVRFGEILKPDGALLDQVLVSVFRAPRSYTGEDSVEIGCHSSSYIVNCILSLLVDAGARLAGPGEFTRRAFLNGKMDLAQAEAVADVIAAESEAQHRVALSQLKGGYSSELKALRDRLVEISALMELELDFSEEEVEFADRGKLASLLDICIVKIGNLVDSFREGNAIRNGVPVAIAGAPNSGKSTLLNALLGDDRAIVSDIPGTTRDTVEETVTLNGLKLRFIDTAGIRESVDPVEKMGMERSLEAVGKARIIIVLLDPLSPAESIAVLKNVRSRVEDWQKVLVVLNKKDLVGNELPGTGKAAGDWVDAKGGCVGCLKGNDFNDVNGAVWISAKTGEGLDELKQSIASCCPICSEQTVVTNVRHYEALSRALANLRTVRGGLGILSCAESVNHRSGTDGGEVDVQGLMPGETGSLVAEGGCDAQSLGSGGGEVDATSPLPTELLCEDLRAALRELGSIFGEVTTDEVLGEIFGRFCIGK